MRKYLWLLVLVIPPWVAAELEAPKWVVLLCVAPFFLFATTLGDPEDLLAESFEPFRKSLLAAIAIGGLALGVAFFLLWSMFFSAT